MYKAGTSSPRDLQKILKNAQLPALPQSAIRLLELSRDPENGPSEFAVAIEADPGLTGQVLKFVNSSYFGFSREISSVKLGITLVGVRTVKNFALWSAVFSLVPNPKCGPFDLKSLWQDSLRRALFARAFSKLQGVKEAEETFAAALLQDMAVPLLAKELPDEYLPMLDARQDGERRLSDLERERFGWTHAEAAAQMARGWNMPDTFATSIQQHVFVEGLADCKQADGVASVALSALLPSTSDSAWAECAQFEAAFHGMRRETKSSLPELLSRVDKEFGEFAPVLKLANPGKPLVTWYEEAAVVAS